MVASDRILWSQVTAMPALLFLKIRQELKKKYAHDHEIAALKNLLPGEADPNAAGVAQSQAGFIFRSWWVVLEWVFTVFFFWTFLLRGQDAEGGEEQWEQDIRQSWS